MDSARPIRYARAPSRHHGDGLWIPVLALVAATATGCASTVATLSSDAAADVSPDVPPDASSMLPMDAGGGWSVTLADRPLSLACASGRWCWENPLPQGESVFAARALPDGTTWAVGALGTVLRFDGAHWTALPIPTSQPLLSVWGTGQRDVWVCGQQTGGSLNLLARSLWHWDGGAWHAVSTPPGLSPMSVDGTSSADLWLLSNAPGSVATTVWHYDGATFVLATAGLDTTHTALEALWVEAPGRVWAYGGDVGGAHSTEVYLFTAGHWSHVGTVPGDLAFQGQIGGVAGEVYAHVTGFLGSRDRELVRLTDTALTLEAPPVARGGFDDTVVSGNGTLWFVGAQLARRTAGAWQVVAVSPGPAAVGVQPLTILAPDAAGGGYGFNVYGDIYRSTSPTQVGLYSTPWRPRLTRLLGRASVPLGAAPLETGAVLVRGPDGLWSRTGVGNGGGDVRDLVVDDRQRPVFALRTDNALVQLDPAGAPGAVVTPMGTAVVEASVNAGVAWAISAHGALRFDGTAFVPAAPLPALVGTLDSAQITLDHVWSEGEHAWATGGYREHSEVPSQDAVLCDLTVTAARCVSVPFVSSAFGGLWSQGSGTPLWTLFNGGLATVDRATLAVSAIPPGLTWQGAPLVLRGLRGNDRTGQLIALSSTAAAASVAVVIAPSARTVTLFPIPLGQYSASVLSVYLGDDGTVWSMSESAQIQRYTP